MNINWYGQTCFRIQSQKGKTGGSVVLIDLFSKETGLKPPKNDADILIMSKPGIKKELVGNSFFIEGPGEYDIKDIYIKGYRAIGSGSAFYTIDTEDIKICHLGFIKNGEKGLTPEQIELIGDIDILMIPVGGGESLDAKSAVKIMGDIEPKIIIPMNYKIPKLNQKLDDLSLFSKTLGVKSIPKEAKLSIKKKDISSQEVKIIALES